MGKDAADENEKQRQKDGSAWDTADFLLVNPTHFAVAMRDVTSLDAPRFHVAAIAREREAEERLSAAWDQGIPIINEDPVLARRIATRSNAGDLLDESSAEAVAALWRERQYVPASASLIVFNDLRHRRQRVGFKLLDTETGFDFAALSGMGTEPIRRELVQPGSLRSDLTDDELRSHVDFWEYSLYHIRRSLSSPKGQRMYQRVVVVVRPEYDRQSPEVDARIAQLASELTGTDPKKHTRTSLKDTYKRLVGQALTDLGTRVAGDDLNQEIGGLSDKARASRDREAAVDGLIALVQLQLGEKLQSEAVRLRSEIQADLARLDIPVLERDQGLSDVISERENWDRPSFETASTQRLVGASHVVSCSIRLPRRSGRYELSIRVVDVSTAEILWADQGDRLDRSEQAIDLVITPYLLQSGTLSVVRFTDSVRQNVLADATLSSYLPLRLPTISLAPSEAEPPKRGRTTPRRRQGAQQAWYDPTLRLGFVDADDSAHDGAIRYRDLFETRMQTIPREAISSIAEVRSLADVPAPDHLRYVIWRLSKAVLPPAGLITNIASSIVRTDLSSANALRPGDRLTVVHFTPGVAATDPGYESVLPLELVVTEVHTQGSAALVTNASDPVPTVGDAAYLRPLMKPTVAVLSIASDLGRVSTDDLRSRGFSRSEAEEYCRNIAAQLQSVLEACLVELKVVVVDRANIQKILAEQHRTSIDPDTAVEAGRLLGATHLLMGTIFPALDDTIAELRVVEMRSGRITEQVRFTFSKTAMSNWKP